MALYTGKGDGGTTKLFDSRKGERVSKSSPVFDALGTFDELNTVVGWCKPVCAVDWLVGGKSITNILLDVQQHLFTIQAELAGAKKSIPAKNVKEVEELIAIIDEQLPEITTFFIPGGTELSARLDIARAVSRRAERTLVTVTEEGTKISAHTLIYANRLSSLLYALVRFVNHKNEIADIPPTYVK